MSAAHRPLSDWVVRVPSAPSPADTVLINDGDERADARSLPLFSEGWVRRAVVPGSGADLVLALQNPDSGLTYAELDDHGVPLRVGRGGAELIARIETSWPRAEFEPVDLDTFHGLSRELRYLLLLRLNQEGSTPPPEVFRRLPWEPVSELGSAVVALLDGGGRPTLSAEASDLGHWVTPAAVGVTGPLEQLYEGVAEGDPVLTARGGTSLCAGVGSADPARFPAPVSAVLAEVLHRLASLNPFLRHAATLAAERLAGGRTSDFVTTLDSDLPMAASGTDDRTVVRRLGADGPLTVRAEVTAGGRMRFAAELALPESVERDRLLDTYGGAFVPLSVSTTERTLRFWVALEARRRWLSGTLEVSTARGRFDIGAEGALTGAWGFAGVSPEELLPSLAGADRGGLRTWRAAAELTPVGNPLRRALSLLDGYGREA